MSRRRHSATFIELFTPKLITVLREGYSVAALQADFVAGLTGAIVALFIWAAPPEVRELLASHGVRSPALRF